MEGGIDAAEVNKWRRLTREDVEAFSDFGGYFAEDLTYMSSIAFRYFMPSVMILFLTRPGAIDFEGFISVVSRCEAAFWPRLDGYADGQVALTAEQGAAFYTWFEQLNLMIREFDLRSHEEHYAERIRLLQIRSQHYVPNVDFDASTLQKLQDRCRSSKG